MICLMIMIMDMLIEAITGNGFIKDPVSLAIACFLELMILMVISIIYQVSTGGDLL